ncbi:PDDEXK-like family protein [Aeromonas hydrophila]|uniref:PDDEXK-like family protein n=1 Tax=Aeromonas hydrophila TaxID=644 RepID=UPI001CF0B9A0|nr:PD-(D/E)XK nuclease family protein [Aeromonas hydrophila]UCM59471.1 PD-(D/E)XK nuclease family protein [Aeromonas hydrophila]
MSSLSQTEATDAIAPASNNQQYRWLTELIFDSKELDKLGGMVSEFNLFEAMGMVRQEIRHSHFLGTLFNPREPHGLGSRFFESLLSRLLYDLPERRSGEVSLLDIDLCDYDDLQVFREQDRIDLLLVSEQNRQVFVIENKIDAGEHGNQLERYEQAVHRRYPEHRKVFVFLTLDGSEASRDGWLNLSYAQVIECLSELVTDYGHQIPPSARIGIEHYITLFKRYFMEDTEIAELCRRIYKKHQKALDLIFEHRPADGDGRTERRDWAKDVIALVAEQHGWEIDSETRTMVRYAHLPWDDRKGMRSSNWTKSGRVVLFEIQSNTDKLELKLLIGPSSDAALRDHLFGCVEQSKVAALSTRKLRQSPQWSQVYSLRLLDKKHTVDEPDEEACKKQIDKKLQHFWSHDWPLLKVTMDKAIETLP